jgi:hypothetical protein
VLTINREKHELSIEKSETSSGDSETASLVMSGPANLGFMAPLHQMRVSQIPLRPSEHATVHIDGRNAFDSTNDQNHKSSPIEMQSSLDHVRYNIVGKCSPLFMEFFGRADNVE